MTSCCHLDSHDFPSIERSLKHVETLYRESHFSVDILQCPECQCLFLKLFSEQVSYYSGDDPMECVIVRLSSATESALRKLGPPFNPLQIMGGITGDWWKMGYYGNEKEEHMKRSGHFSIMRPD